MRRMRSPLSSVRRKGSVRGDAAVARCYWLCAAWRVASWPPRLRFVDGSHVALISVWPAMLREGLEEGLALVVRSVSWGTSAIALLSVIESAIAQTKTLLLFYPELRKVQTHSSRLCTPRSTIHNARAMQPRASPWSAVSVSPSICMQSHVLLLQLHRHSNILF